MILTTGVEMPLFRVPAALALALAGLTAQAQDSRDLEGSLTYPARVALPAEARIVVEARGATGELLGETRLAAEGRQVPLPFTLDIPAGMGADLRAGIFVGGETRWLSETVQVPSGTQDVTLGEVILHPHRPLGFSSALRCGERRLRLVFAGEKALLATDAQVFELTRERTASGAKYASADGRVSVWTRADTARVELDDDDGGALPDCVIVPPDPEPAWTARGNEPGWTVEFREGRLRANLNYGSETIRARLPAPGISEGAFVYDLPEAGLRIRVTETLCRDGMTGMPYPRAVTLDHGGETLRGCGGDPMALLTGPEWVVEDIGGTGLIDGSRVTIAFDRDGRASGRATCNRYTGTAELSGEGLRLGPLAGTRMACPEALMAQERRFLATL
ncbi:MAG: META domain-containing protein, partial [Paracoccaceae bacterium]